MSTPMLKDVLMGLWWGLSTLAIFAGTIMAILLPNGFPGVLIGLVGAAALLGYIERERHPESFD